MRCIAAFLVCLFWIGASGVSAQPKPQPRVLIVSIDGLRPDCALRADMPVMRSLMQRGSFSFWATTTPMAVTIPSHTSMLTGVTIERHGITGNNDEAVADAKILVPTIFELARDRGISTGMAAGKSKFSIYQKTVEHSWVTSKSVCADAEVADEAIRIIKQHQPRLMFVHLPATDASGHTYGWGSRAQIETITNADQQLGRVLEALEQEKLAASTTVIVSADHGGSGLTHGAMDDRSRFIPWIIAGPGVGENVDLSQFRELHIRTYDTFATACKVLKLMTPSDIDGKPIVQAFPATDLMKSTSSPPAEKPAATQPVSGVVIDTGWTFVVTRSSTTQPIRQSAIDNRQ